MPQQSLDNSTIGLIRELFAGESRRGRRLILLRLAGALMVISFLALFICVCFPIFVLTTLSSIFVTCVRMTITLSLHFSSRWRHRLRRRMRVRAGRALGILGRG